MSLDDSLTTLFAHHRWANLRLVECCSALNSQQLDATTVGTYGSIRATLEHMVKAEQSYLSRIATGNPGPRSQEKPPLSLEEMAVSLEESGTGLMEWAAKIRPEDTVDVGWKDGTTRDVPKTIILSQAIYHAGEHRAQVMAILTGLGIEVPDLQVWDYFEERGG